MSKIKILYITHEMTPYLEMTHMADTARLLPQKMQDKDMEVRVFMPKFGIIKDRKHRLHEVIRLSGINIPVFEDDYPLLIKVASLPAAKMQIYFLDNDDLFHKRGYFGDEKTPWYPDNDERVAFFNKGIMEIIHKLEWKPDIIHCQGWMCALAPMFAKTISRNEALLRGTKIIFTPFEETFTETLGDKFIEKAIFPNQDESAYKYLSNPGINDFYKTGIEFADAITIGSEDVNPELIKFAYETNKPVLAYTNPEDKDKFIENHIEFYHQILESTVVEK